MVLENDIGMVLCPCTHVTDVYTNPYTCAPARAHTHTHTHTHTHKVPDKKSWVRECLSNWAASLVNLLP